MTWILGILSSFWTKAVFIGAAVLAVVGVLLAVRNSGRVVERAEQLEKINEMAREHKKRAVHTRSYSRTQLNDELRKQRDELRQLLQSG